MRSQAEAKDINLFSYIAEKALENSIKIDIEGDGFLLTRLADGCILGKLVTVGEICDYIMGYESGHMDGMGAGYKLGLDDASKYDYGEEHF